jgi:hypothetical protein
MVGMVYQAMMLAIDVDDMIVTSNDEKEIDQLKVRLEKKN